MAIIDDLVHVIITRDKLDFSNIDAEPELLIIGGSKPDLAAEVKAYYSLEEVLADYLVTTDEYKFSAAFFAQSVRPNLINIGQRLAAVDANPRETYLQAYTRIKTFFRRFYYVSLVGNYADADILAIAGAVNAEERVCSYITNDPAILTTATNTLANTLKTSSYDRTFGAFTVTSLGVDGETDFDNAINAAWLGVMIPKPIGQAIWAYQELRGVSPYELNDTQYANAMAKNINIYTNVMGFSATLKGTMASGTYIDSIVGTDFLRNLIRYEFMRMLMVNDRVPYTNTGLLMSDTAIKVALNRAVNREIIREYRVYAPKLKDVDPADFLGRLARFRVEAVPTNAIQEGVITTNVGVYLN